MTRRHILGVLIGAPAAAIAAPLLAKAAAPEVSVTSLKPMVTVAEAAQWGTDPLHPYWELPDPSDRIIGMQPWRDKLFVFTQYKVYELDTVYDLVSLVRYREISQWQQPPNLDECFL